LGLMLVCLFTAATLIGEVLLAPVILALAATIAVFACQADRVGSTRGSLRWLVMSVLAVPMFLLALPYLERAQLTPENLAGFEFAARLIGIGLLLLLAGAPFHAAVPAVAAESPPVVATLLILCRDVVVLFLLDSILRTYPWLTGFYDVSRWLLWIGLLTVGWSGIMASVQQEYGQLFGYASLFGYGATLMALGIGGSDGLTLAVGLFAARSLSMLTCGVGMSVVKHYCQGLGFARVGESARALPVSLAGMFLGGLSLAGLPLTAGLAGYWVLVQYLGQSLPRASIVAILSGLGVSVGYLRGLNQLTVIAEARVTRREPWYSRVLVLIGILSSLALAVQPQLLSGLVLAVAAALSTAG